MAGSDFHASHHGPAFEIDQTYVRRTDGTVKSIPPIRRPARLWHGASTPFCMVELLTLLGTGGYFQKCNYWEATGIVHDVAAFIKDELSVQKLSMIGDLLNKDDIIDLQTSFRNAQDLVKKYIQTNLLNLSDMKPVTPLSERTVEAWYGPINDFMNLSFQIANDAGFGSLWRQLDNGLRTRYQQCTRTVTQAGAIISNESASITADSPPWPTLEYQIPDSESGRDSLGPSTHELFDAIIEYYRAWCTREGDLCPITALEQLDGLRAVIHHLLALPPDGRRSLGDVHISRRENIVYRGWQHHFKRTLRRVIGANLSTRCRQLRLAVNTKNCTEAVERDFSTVARQLRAAAFIAPNDVLRDLWEGWAPNMILATSYDASMKELLSLSAQYQELLAATCPKKRMWITLWRSLATTFLICKNNHFKLPEADNILEKSFFENALICTMFTQVLDEGAILSPTIVENIVAQYCIEIANARQGNGPYTSDVVRYTEAPLSERIYEIQTRYHQNMNWSYVVSKAMQKTAVRLNAVQGGPGYVRRASPGYEYWSFDLVKDVSLQVLDTPALVHFEHANAQIQTEVQLPQSFTNDLVLPTEKVQKSPDDVVEPPLTSIFRNPQPVVLSGFPSPLEMNLRCSFDYVSIPFAETRALEVAQSQQITREMSSTTVRTQGAQVADVVNVPPGHTSTPGDLSVWATWLPYGPVDLVKAIWSRAKDNRSFKSVQRARPLPSITARHMKEGPRNRANHALSPKVDFQWRISKPARRQHQHVPRLRGGGSGQRVPDERTRILMLAARIAGFWPASLERPTTSSLRTQFLEPTNWDLEQATSQARILAQARLRAASSPSQLRQNDDGGISVESDNHGDDSPETHVAQSRGERFDGRDDEDGEEFSNDNGWLNMRGTTQSPISAGDQNQDLQSGQASSLTNVATQNHSTLTPSAAPFTIYEDPTSSAENPQPQAHRPPGSSPPVLNQENQRHEQDQRDRAAMGLLPRQQGDNDSDAENIDPNESLSSHSRSVHEPTLEESFLTPPPNNFNNQCTATACHLCPMFPGQYHHICPDIYRVQNSSTPDSSILITGVGAQITGYSPRNHATRNSPSSQLNSADSNPDGNYRGSPIPPIHRDFTAD